MEGSACVTLDISQLVAALTDASSEDAEHVDRMNALRDAFDRLDSADLRARLSTARTSWLLASTNDDFRDHRSRPPRIDDYTAVATDGSSIAPDRHSALRFYVTNIGLARFRYGRAAAAEITSRPVLCADESCLYAPSVVRRVPLTGQLFGLKRQVDELRAGIESVHADDPAPVVLQDGSLIFWGLESQADAVADWILEEAMDAFTKYQERRVPVAGFISYPGATDVMNSLRVSICDYPAQGRAVNCDHCRNRILTENHSPACDVLPNVPDRVLWSELARLEPGARTAVYASASQILARYRPDHWIHFFYVKLEREVARVEIPRWVAAAPDMLDRVHAVIIDQCERGRGYPSALQEAHEAAVIRGPERRAVETLIERALAGRGLLVRRSGKDGSKRVRFV
jgi:hypothetical protein